MSEWRDIATAPKDGTLILGWCVHEADPYTLDGGKTLTPYGAHAECLAHVEDGPHVIVWGGGYDDRGLSEDLNDGYMPDWWFRHGSDFEAPANPTLWMPLPEPPQ